MLLRGAHILKLLRYFIKLELQLLFDFTFHNLLTLFGLLELAPDVVDNSLADSFLHNLCALVCASSLLRVLLHVLDVLFFGRFD